MSQSSRPWTANATGDGTSYTAAQWRSIYRNAFGSGVISGLAVSGTASPLTMAVGSAWVDGLFYEATVAQNLSVTTPAALTGGDVILEANYAAQTVRVSARRSTSGDTGIPALTQTSETTFQIRLATFTITAAGVITVTDARGWAVGRRGTAGRVPFFGAGGVLQDDAGLTYDAVNDRVGIGTATPADMLHIVANADATRGALIGNGSAGAAAYTFVRTANDEDATAGLLRNSSANPGYAGPGSLSLIQSAARAVGIVTSNVLRLMVTAAGRVGIGTATPAVELDVVGSAAVSGTLTREGTPVPNLWRRQGGSATDWSTPGTTSYVPPAATRVQAGTISFTGGSAVVTFPTAFAQPPIIVATIIGTAGISGSYVVITGVTASTATLTAFVSAGSSQVNSVTVQWIAIGPA